VRLEFNRVPRPIDLRLCNCPVPPRVPVDRLREVLEYSEAGFVLAEYGNLELEEAQQLMVGPPLEIAAEIAKGNPHRGAPP
jgi:hypothetical protein